jgi:hypothetical protein
MEMADSTTHKRKGMEDICYDDEWNTDTKLRKIQKREPCLNRDPLRQCFQELDFLLDPLYSLVLDYLYFNIFAACSYTMVLEDTYDFAGFYMQVVVTAKGHMVLSSIASKTQQDHILPKSFQSLPIYIFKEKGLLFPVYFNSYADDDDGREKDLVLHFPYTKGNTRFLYEIDPIYHQVNEKCPRTSFSFLNCTEARPTQRIKQLTSPIFYMLQGNKILVTSNNALRSCALRGQVTHMALLQSESKMWNKLPNHQSITTPLGKFRIGYDHLNPESMDEAPEYGVYVDARVSTKKALKTSKWFVGNDWYLCDARDNKDYFSSWSQREFCDQCAFRTACKQCYPQRYIPRNANNECMCSLCQSKPIIFPAKPVTSILGKILLLPHQHKVVVFNSSTHQLMLFQLIQSFP